jgi:thiamine biosynthesis lipoprotein
VSIEAGGLASSSTTVRAWRRGGRCLHHIVDPTTGDCASDHWRLVTTAGSSCVEANAFSTAAVVWGESAPDRLERLDVPARFVRHDGVVTAVGRWPADQGARTIDAVLSEVVGP